MGADFGAFFDQADAQISSFFCCQLLQPNGRSQASGAATNDDDVKFHGFAFHDVS